MNEIPPVTEEVKEEWKESSLNTLEKKISLDTWDTESWTSLLEGSIKTEHPDKVRRLFDRFLLHFPTSARHWLMYAEWELKQQDPSRVEQIYATSLRTCPQVDLWKNYLGYVVAKEKDSKEIVKRAFELALNTVGVDKEAGKLWQAYLDWLKNEEVTMVWDEQRKVEAIRKVYHRCLGLPLNILESLWKEYEVFENLVNKPLAKKTLSENSPAFINARNVLREVKVITEPLNYTVLAVPPTRNLELLKQKQGWKRFIEWEKTNPLKLDDPNLHNHRISLAYRQALMYLRFYAEIWFEAAQFLLSIGKKDDAIHLLRQGCEALPESSLLHLLLAELEEATSKDLAKVQGVYDGILQSFTDKWAAVNKEYDAMIPPAPVAVVTDGESRERLREQERGWARQKETIEQQRRSKLNVISQSATLIWIAYMHAARRLEGIKAARTVFGQARKSPLHTFHLFVASAMMEYYCSKDKQLPVRIFEVGLRQHTESAFVKAYLDYLIMINDDSNLRALFERVIGTLPKAEARSIWELFVQYEACYGDQSGIEAADKRLAQVYPESNNLSRFLKRQRLYNLDPLTLEFSDSAMGMGDGDFLVPSAMSSSGAAIATSGGGGGGGGRMTGVISGGGGEKDDGQQGNYTRPQMDQWQMWDPLTAPSSNAKRPPPVRTPPLLPMSALRLPPGPSLSEILTHALTVLPAQYNGPAINEAELLELLVNKLPAVPIPEKLLAEALMQSQGMPMPSKSKTLIPGYPGWRRPELVEDTPRPTKRVMRAEDYLARGGGGGDRRLF